MSEKTYPMVRLLDPAGEGLWVATQHIIVIALATQGTDDNPMAISRVLVQHGQNSIAVEVQGTPDEIVQFLAGETSDDAQEDTDTLDVDENGYPTDLQYGSGYDK